MTLYKSGIFEHIDSQQQKSKKDKIVDGIMDAIACNDLSKGDALPSVNKFMQRLGYARMTVVRALNTLKEKGVIVSTDKVGYFVRDCNFRRERKIFMFLSEFNYYHEVLFNTIIDKVRGQDITIDLFFHHCNPNVFKSVLTDNFGSYCLFVISVFDNTQISSLMTKASHPKLLQIIRTPLLKDCSSIHQDFFSGLKRSLEKLKPRLNNYSRFILVFPGSKIHPEEIKTTFIEFCAENNINHLIESEVLQGSVVKGTAFWVIEDSDLIDIIKIGEEKGLSLGSDIGILSYNETPMKEVIRNGITVVSANFSKMGEAIAGFIINPKPTIEVFEPEIIMRRSF